METTGPDAEPPGVLFKLRNVACTFGKKGGVVIDRLDIRAGRVTAILGRSGSGKSTLLHLLGGMLAPEKGAPNTELELTLPSARGGQTYDLRDTRHWPSLRRCIGFVFQNPYLFGEASSRLNLSTSLAAAGLPIDRARIESLWRELDLDHGKLDQPARVLSGGMRHRAALARALVRDPMVVFADEPTANLDDTTGDIVMSRLFEWQQKVAGRSLILITHDIHRAAAACIDDIVVLSLLGRLSPLRTWPSPNPRSPAVLREWMDDAPAATDRAEGESGDFSLARRPLTGLRRS